MENHPLGRTEWVLFYGLLLGAHDEARAAFAQTRDRYFALRDLAAGVQDIVSGFLIQDGGGFDFTGVAVFWLASCVLATLLPVFNWKAMQRKVVE